MEDGKIRVVWNGKRVRGEPVVLGCVDTTIPSILMVLEDMGKHPNEFNDLIVDAKVKPHLPVPCILWTKGDVVGEVLRHLRTRGLCEEVSVAK